MMLVQGSEDNGKVLRTCGYIGDGGDEEIVK